MDFATRLVNLLHSCGWIKTEVFENDYNMVVDTSTKIMSMLYERWYHFQTVWCFGVDQGKNNN